MELRLWLLKMRFYKLIRPCNFPSIIPNIKSIISLIYNNTVNTIIQSKNNFLLFIRIRIYSLRIKISKILKYVGVPHTIALIIVGIHLKKRHYEHHYNIGIWKYIMKLY